MTKHKQAKKIKRLKNYKKRINIHRNNVATPVHEETIAIIMPKTAGGEIINRTVGKTTMIHFMQIGEKKIKVKDKKPEIILPKSKKHNKPKKHDKA